MFTSFLDWFWMVLAVCVGTAFARYVVPLLMKGAKATATLAERATKDEDDA